MAALNDTFTDTNGVALNSHTSDSSHTWTKQTGVGSGVLEIQSNNLRGAVDGNSGFYTSSYTPPSADYELAFSIEIGSSLPSINIGAGIRCETDGDGIFVRFEGFGDALELVKLTAGQTSEVVLDSFSPSSSTTYAIRLVATGGNVEWFVNTVSQGTHSLGGDLSAAGLVGCLKYHGVPPPDDVDITTLTVVESGGTNVDVTGVAAVATASGPTPQVSTLTRPYVLVTIA